MMDYNIGNLFEEIFGLKVNNAYKPKLINQKQEKVDSGSYTGITYIEDESEVSRLSYLGTPIIHPITFKAGVYQYFDPQGKVVDEQLQDFELPATTLVNFRRAKTQTKVKVNAGDGTNKERSGFTDWNIDIRGLCLKDPSHPQAQDPYEQLEKILSFEKLMSAIKVDGFLFEIRDIYNITIDDISTPQVKGAPGVVPFQLRCSSDKPFELF
ncbi:hypothetical protein EZY14_009330 [Kordia sp. TARA_039_SRF]|nr:hypothetical protein EZY14_009330 [Kordia sp. TARA_039_SRF]